MSVETNKAIIRQYFDLSNAGEFDRMMDILSQDYVYECMGKAPGTHFTRNKAQIRAALTQPGLFAAPMKVFVTDMIGEGDRVAVQAYSHAELVNEQIYSNNYHFLVELSGGKIRYIGEYLCTATLMRVIWPARAEAEARTKNL